MQALMKVQREPTAAVTSLQTFQLLKQLKFSNL